MHTDRIKLALLVVLAMAAPATAQTPYDGPWQVTVVTKTGGCEPSQSASITVRDGVIEGANDINGTVSADGVVKVSMGPASADGRLNGNSGFGKWHASSVGLSCSGHWQASKQ